ncbi:MAG: hypothetical protein AMS27_04020 [Bacteroides sp. SM23_62_1]|nr:MAG: hypothetical protein AMS27_04020 [Bacteroides sp. SM23_62_1]
MKADTFSYLIGVDAGTTSVKAVLINISGDIVASEKQEYTLDTGPNDLCEIDPEIYWDITCVVIRKIIRNSGINPELVSGIAFSSQGETLIVVDSNGKPLRKAIVWLDNRSVQEAQLIEEKFGKQHIMNITGQPEVVATWPATRILWLKKNESRLFNRISKYLLVEDYLLFRLTGRFYSEHSLVSSTLYFNIITKQWWQEMLDYLEISQQQLPELMISGSKVHHLTAEAAHATGLTTKTIAVTGAYDHPSGAIGAGNITPGMVTCTIGASMAMCVTLEKPVRNISMKLPCQCHAVHNLYFLLPYTQTAGLILKWYKDEFCREEIEIARKQNSNPYAIIIEHAEKIPPGTEGLILLPHFMGTGSPEFNSRIKGVFAGITPWMKKGHFVRAILEAIVSTIEHNLQTMKQNGIVIEEIHAIGGGARSHLWNQIIADMTGIPVITRSQTENACLGAAILAGIGSGVFKDIMSACKVCVKQESKYEPNPAKYVQYQELYKKYLSLYRALENYW